MGLSIRGHPLNTGNPLFRVAVALPSPTPLASEDALGRYDSQLQPKSAIPICTLISISDLAEDSGDRCVVSEVFGVDCFLFFCICKAKAYSGAVSSNPPTLDLCVKQGPGFGKPLGVPFLLLATPGRPVAKLLLGGARPSPTICLFLVYCGFVHSWAALKHRESTFRGSGCAPLANATCLGRRARDVRFTVAS